MQDGCYVVLMPKAAIKRSGLTPVTDPATELIQAATPPCNPSQPALQPRAPRPATLRSSTHPQHLATPAPGHPSTWPRRPLSAPADPYPR